MLLTGFPTEEIELKALGIYVDGYFDKQKSPTVLGKYIERILNTDSEAEDERIEKLYSRSEKIEMDLKTHVVTMDGEEVDLTPKEYDLLKMFLENKGLVLNREDIIEDLWDTNIESIDDRVVDKHIKRLRQKIHSFSIVTVRGYGYKWDE